MRIGCFWVREDVKAWGSRFGRKVEALWAFIVEGRGLRVRDYDDSLNWSESVENLNVMKWHVRW